MDNGNIQFKENHFYTRREIYDALGGNLQTYLPTESGKVVCACLQMKINPTAPRVIYCGLQERVMRAGEILASQAEPIPVFIKCKVNEWEYIGMYKVNRATTDPEELKQHSTEGERELSRIIFMEPQGLPLKEFVS